MRGKDKRLAIKRREASFRARTTRIIAICRVSRLAKIPKERALGIPGLIARDKVIVALTTKSGTCCRRSSSSTDP